MNNQSSDLTTSARVIALIRTIYGPIQSGPLDLDTRLDAALVDDLGLDSLDLVELAMTTEDEFGVSITDDEAAAFGPPRSGEAKTVAAAIFKAMLRKALAEGDDA